MEKIKYEFKNNTLNDKNLQEHFKNSDHKFFEIMIASSILGGIDLRNLHRELDNLDEEKEMYPYNDEQIKMIDRYIELEHRQEELENIAEEEMEL